MARNKSDYLSINIKRRERNNGCLVVIANIYVLKAIRKYLLTKTNKQILMQSVFLQY